MGKKNSLSKGIFLLVESKQDTQQVQLLDELACVQWELVLEVTRSIFALVGTALICVGIRQLALVSDGTTSHASVIEATRCSLAKVTRVQLPAASLVRSCLRNLVIDSIYEIQSITMYYYYYYYSPRSCDRLAGG